MTYWLQGARQRPRAQDTQEQSSSNLGIFDNPRSRLTVALLATIGLVVFLAFVAFPPNRMLVDADGVEVVVVSRDNDPLYALEAAGVQQAPGDILIENGEGIVLERAQQVLADVDGFTLSWRSRADTVGELLAEADIGLGPHDKVHLNGRVVSLSDEVAGLASARSPGLSGATPALVTRDHAAGLDIKVVRAVPVQVVEDGTALSVYATGSTLGDVLREAGVRLGPADIVYPSPATPVRAGMQVRIDHAKQFSLQLGETALQFYTHQATLEAALAEVGLTFGPEDRIEPSLAVPVTDGLAARVIRVTGRTIKETDPVPHVTVFRPDDSLVGTQTRRVEGTPGSLVTEYRVVIEDGVELEKTFVDQYFDPAPQDTVIYYSASALNSTTFVPPDHEVSQVMRLYGTWYNAASSGKPATHPAYGITRSGLPLTKGIVATDPNVIPLGTRLYVPGYGFAIAADTGGGIIGDRIDMGYPDGVEVDWYTGWTDVYILAP